MTSIPRDKKFDSSFSLLNEGYLFITKHGRELQSDVFETRIMLQKVICMFGEEAATVFYDPSHFTHKGGLRPMTLRLLQDKGSVAMMDEGEHQVRKQMFHSLVTPERIKQLVNIMEEHWYAEMEGWKKKPDICLLDEVQLILCHAVCEWAGVPLSDEEAKSRTHEFRAMIEGSASLGPKSWWALLLRARTERWAQSLIEGVRARSSPALPGSPVYTISSNVDSKGKLLSTKIAAVELINILRPVVALSLYITFAAHALHAHPAARKKLEAAEEGSLENFVQEVRRFYPFFPFVGGQVLHDFTWRGSPFSRGTWVLLDLYGTNHDPRIWGDPGVFRPDRFKECDRSPYSFIPQGGGDFLKDHRCAGENITIALMLKAVKILVSAMQYQVPEQDLTINLSQMPSIPKSRFLISKVRTRSEAVKRKRKANHS